MELASNDKFVDALQDTGNPYIEIRVGNDDGADSPLHKTAGGIELLVNALMVDFYIGQEGRPDIFLTSLDYQISNLLNLRNAYFRGVFKEDIDEEDIDEEDIDEEDIDEEQINNLLNLKYELDQLSKDFEEKDTPIPDAFKNAFD